MAHQVQTPPPDSGGGSLVAGGNNAHVVVTWVPPHDMQPKVERRRTERAEKMRLEIEAMLNAPAGEEAHIE
jgi:hypothetical protein